MILIIDDDEDDDDDDDDNVLLYSVHVCHSVFTLLALNHY